MKTTPEHRAPIRVRPLFIVVVAAAAMLWVAFDGRAERAGSLDRSDLANVQMTSFNVPDLAAALADACAVTGCDASDLVDMFRAGLPAMTDDELAEAEALTQAIAAQSEATLARYDASGADRPEIRARLAAQAMADEAIARFHAAELARRADTPAS
ncbi:hypothetical protein [Jannaschia aquimarina]|uniref:Uncharacterized protein n=1 Tax=Jannaschia aquimarina TaxID=935700 RepID=A0A0D1EL83_9RHOB|nr:hypothetical protein [Jannaschia aquimarina]KIT16525.1 hypothetical protein jaqu_17530 [Jannaschia aquimarina]SNT06499.1 hypothetical protein SAMN05421775_10592 [Jannaschia aquimarina]